MRVPSLVGIATGFTSPGTGVHRPKNQKLTLFLLAHIKHALKKWKFTSNLMKILLYFSKFSLNMMKFVLFLEVQFKYD
jgi:hypothetical protein